MFGQHPKSILIVDDEENFVEIFSAKLKSDGFKVDSAPNGEEGLRKINANPPDMVLLDMKMPGLSGADVLFKLKGDPKTKDVKIVFLTSIGLPEKRAQDESLARAVGAAGFLDKSEDLDKVIEAIRALLK